MFISFYFYFLPPSLFLTHLSHLIIFIFLPFLACVFLRALLVPQKETAQHRTPQVGLGVEHKVTRIRHQQKNTRTGLSEFLQA